MGRRELTMQVECGYVASVACSFGRRKQAKMNLLTVDGDLGIPLPCTLVPTHTFVAGCVVFPQPDILLVLIERHPKIRTTIVKRVHSFLVIDLVRIAVFEAHDVAVHSLDCRLAIRKSKTSIGIPSPRHMSLCMPLELRDIRVVLVIEESNFSLTQLDCFHKHPSFLRVLVVRHGDAEGGCPACSI